MVYCFFFNDTATTEIYTLSLHDALPILEQGVAKELARTVLPVGTFSRMKWTVNLRSLFNFLSLRNHEHADRKSTRLNSSHANISYAVFCLKKKKKHTSALMTTQYNVYRH